MGENDEADFGNGVGAFPKDVKGTLDDIDERSPPDMVGAPMLGCDDA
jgi:hypothetical protein